MPASTPKRLYRYPTGDDVIDVAGDIERLARDVDNDVAAGSFPIGMMTMFGGVTAPTGWLLCNGAQISRTTYAALFAILGTRYGGGDGSTTFTLPTMQGRAPMGHFPGGPWAATLGQFAGTADAVVVSHNHAGADHLHPVSGTTGTISADHSHATSPGGLDFVLTGFTRQVATERGSPSFGVGFSPATSGVSANHTHTFAATSGAADRALTTSTVGVSGTNQNIPPVVVVNFIIKAI